MLVSGNKFLSNSPSPNTKRAIVPDVKFYDALSTSYRSAFSQNPGLHQIIQKILAELPPSSNVLDIGCGAGNAILTTMVNHGHQVTGIDLSQDMLELCEKQVPDGNFEQTNMLEWKPKDKAGVNAIFAMFSMFSLSRADMGTMASRIREWLSPNGIICIGTIAAEDLETTPEMFDATGQCTSGIGMKFMGSKCESMTTFTKEGWKAVLKEAGFEIFYTQSNLFVPTVGSNVETNDEMHYFIMARKIHQGRKLPSISKHLEGRAAPMRIRIMRLRDN